MGLAAGVRLWLEQVRSWPFFAANSEFSSLEKCLDHSHSLFRVLPAKFYMTEGFTFEFTHDHFFVEFDFVLSTVGVVLVSDGEATDVQRYQPQTLHIRLVAIVLCGTVGCAALQLLQLTGREVVALQVSIQVLQLYHCIHGVVCEEQFVVYVKGFFILLEDVCWTHVKVVQTEAIEVLQRRLYSLNQRPERPVAGWLAVQTAAFHGLLEGAVVVFVDKTDSFVGVAHAVAQQQHDVLAFPQRH